MRNKVMSVIAAAAIALSVIPVFADNNDTDNERGVAEQRHSELIDEELIKYESEYSDYTVSAAADDTDTSSLADFYTSSADHGYAYDYFKDTYGEASETLTFYDDLLTACKSFAADYSDVSDTIYCFNHGTYKTYKELPGMIGKQYTQMTSDEIIMVYFMFRNDHPEYYWLSNSLDRIHVHNDETYYDVPVVCVYDKFVAGEYRRNTDERFEEVFEEYLSYLNDETYSVYTKVRLLHDMIIENVEYDDYASDNDPVAHTIFGVLDGDTSTDAVCEGYARTFQLILNKLGIDNIYVTGVSRDQGHAWNFVKLADDNYYKFDVTWDDDTSDQYEFFARGNTYFDTSHTVSTPNSEKPESRLYTLPAVPDDDYEQQAATDINVGAPSPFADKGAVAEATPVPTATPNDFENGTHVSMSYLLPGVPQLTGVPYDNLKYTDLGGLYDANISVSKADGTAVKYNADYTAYYNGKRLSMAENAVIETGWLNGEEVDLSKLDYVLNPGVTIKTEPQYYDTTGVPWQLNELGKTVTAGVTVIPEFSDNLYLSELVSDDPNPDDDYNKLYGLKFTITDPDGNAAVYDEDYIFTYDGVEIPKIIAQHYSLLTVNVYKARYLVTSCTIEDFLAHAGIKGTAGTNASVTTTYYDDSTGYGTVTDAKTVTFTEQTPTPTPEVTATPIVTDAPQPDVTTTPIVTDAPQPDVTTTPVVTDAPQPDVTTTPIVTDAPQPDVTATPIVTDAPQPDVTTTPTAAPEPNYPYLIDSFSVTDADGNPITDITGDEEFDVTVNFTETEGISGTDWLLVAVRGENGVLLGLKYVQNISENNTVTFGALNAAPSEIDAFIWSDLKKSLPLAVTRTMELNNNTDGG